MRRANLDVLPVAARLARDADAGVRREVALSLRDQPADASLRHPGRHRARLRRPGSQLSRSAGHRRDRQGSRRSTIGCGSDLGVKDDPLTWPPAFARIAWRLHVPAAVPDLTARARSAKLSPADRRLALDTLAFIKDPAASKAMLDARRRRTARCASRRLVAAEPHVRTTGRITICGPRSRRPASTIPRRSCCVRS